jgi:hypothetical protein
MQHARTQLTMTCARARRLRCGRGLQLCAALVLAACSVDNATSFGIVLQVESDLATPKDLDSVRVVVTQSGSTLHEETYALGSSNKRLPLRVPIAHRGEGAPASFRVIGMRRGEELVRRLAITAIPSKRWAMLSMRLQYLCVGGEDCEGEQTCVQGSCQSAQVTEADLPEYREGGGLNPGQVQSGVGSCFNLLGCFANASEAQLDDQCAFQINPDIRANQLNVALRLAPESSGVCSAGGCYIPFDEGNEGYTLDAGRVGLPGLICERLHGDGGQRIQAVVFSSACGAKRAGAAVCGTDSQSSDDAATSGMTTGFAPPVAPGCERGSIDACGMCGTRARVCRDGSWSQFGECGDEGECEANEMRPCGNEGVETCGGSCRWGDCLGQRCDGVAVRACERCGTQGRSCGETGQFSDWGACGEQGACEPGTEQACGSSSTSGTQACGGSCEWGPCGDQGCPGAPTEACGMCGTRTRTCDRASGQWSEFGPCSDEGVCMPDAVRACGVNGTQVCGGNCQWDDACAGQTCVGERSMACGNCGTRTRSCDMTTGTWREWSPCTDQGECAPNEERGCGRGGAQVCNGSCRWDSACTGQSCLGATTQTCGNCGEQTRSCDGATGTFGEWSECRDQGECRANSARSCGGSGTQACGADCRWESECSGQSCTGETARPCGNCGLQRRTCDAATGRLSDWGACADERECREGEARSCGSQGTQTCGAECRWGSACTGQVCVEPEERECGNCGRQTSMCDPDTGRANWSTCTGEGQCAPGATQDCGSDGVQRCGMNCRWEDQCTMQDCPPPRPPAEECGNCGTRTATCDAESGEWRFPTSCANERSCMGGDSRGCGPDNTGRQVCSDSCEWQACEITCDEPLMIPCGACDAGIRRGICDVSTGRVIYEEGCSFPSERCTPGTPRTCRTSEGAGTELCTEGCRWPDDGASCRITDPSCEQPEGVACGNCGTTGRCLSSGASGERECVDQGVCAAGTTDAPCQTPRGNGYYPCSDRCELSTTCEVTSFICSEVEGAACDGQCGRWGPCDRRTGDQECIPRDGACVPGSMDAECGGEGRSGYYACSSQCVLSDTCTITSVDCAGTEGAACDGQCGNWGPCDRRTGDQECIAREGACVPGSTDAECGGEGRSGYYACSSQCVLSDTCTITSVSCPGDEGERCDAMCGTWGPCNSQTGDQTCRASDSAVCSPGMSDDCSLQADGGTVTGQRTCGSNCQWEPCRPDSN